MTPRELQIINAFREFSMDAHAGQLRKDGKTPYFDGHIKPVADLVQSRTQFIFDGWVYICVALFHDIKENSIEYFNKNILNFKREVCNFITLKEFDTIMDAVDCITKKPNGEESYTNYLNRVRDNIYAKKVKLEDLTHNMSDLKPCNLKDKYDVSYWYLILTS